MDGAKRFQKCDSRNQFWRASRIASAQVRDRDQPRRIGRDTADEKTGSGNGGLAQVIADFFWTYSMGLFTRNNNSASVTTTIPGQTLAAAGSSTSAASVLLPPQANRNPQEIPAASSASSERNLRFDQLKVRIHQQLVQRLDVQ